VKLLTSREIGGALSRRFFREAKASAAIESDHIVTVFDSGTDPATSYPYMVMEVLQGEDLEHATTRCAPIAPEVAARLGLQATAGLAKAHRTGIVHRDVKPANLFLCQRDSGELLVKVLDFGIAKVVIEAFVGTGGGLTRTGSLLGTPLYMSPEQAQGMSEIS